MNKLIHVAIIHEGTVYSLPEPNRHHHVIRHIVEKTGARYVDGEQGFLDEDGKFLDRVQAKIRARETGQLQIDDPIRKPFGVEYEIMKTIDLSHTDLMDFWKRYSKPTRKDAEELVQDRRTGYLRISATLANYACNLHIAYQCQVNNHDRHGVNVYLQCADLCWEQLPHDVQDRVTPPSWLEDLRNDRVS